MNSFISSHHNSLKLGAMHGRWLSSRWQYILNDIYLECNKAGETDLLCFGGSQQKEQMHTSGSYIQNHPALLSFRKCRLTIISSAE